MYVCTNVDHICPWQHFPKVMASRAIIPLEALKKFFLGGILVSYIEFISINTHTLHMVDFED